MCEPGGYEAWEVGGLVVVDASVSLQYEAILLSEGADDTGPLHCLIQMAVYGRAAHRLQATELTRCGHVETLQEIRNEEPCFKITE